MTALVDSCSSAKKITNRYNFTFLKLNNFIKFYLFIKITNFFDLIKTMSSILYALQRQIKIDYMESVILIRL